MSMTIGPEELDELAAKVSPGSIICSDSIEITKPDPCILDIIKRIIDQNDVILKALSFPVWIVKK